MWYVDLTMPRTAMKKAPALGRPPLPVSEKRRHKVNVPMTDAEQAELRKMARAAKAATVPAFVRSRLFG